MQNKDKNKIFAEAASRHKKNSLKIRSARKYDDLYRCLLVKFKSARGKGHRVNFHWLWSNARKIYRDQQGNPNAVIKKHVIVAFIKRHDIRMRSRQRNRKQPKEYFQEGLLKWHATLRERVIRSGKDTTYNEKWGRFLPEQRFNVDQSPLPFCVNMKKTYHKFDEGKSHRHDKVWISQPGSGLDKRQCTLQVCFRPTGVQPKLAIIFRGTGKRLSDDEKMAWHPDVDIYFQENSWVDTAFSMDWVQKTLKPATHDLNRFLLLCDNLSAQTSERFKEEVSSIKGLVWFGLPNATDLWQPVDAGFAQLLKVLINQQFTDWLDSDDNADRWYGNTEPFPAKERRILISHWAGESYKKLLSQKYEAFRRRMFEKTGCLITADSTDDEKITPEGISSYKVAPPSMIDAISSFPTSNEVEADHAEQEVTVEVIIEEDFNDFNENVLEDCDIDRVFDHEASGKKLKVLYENGWFHGDMYYNNKLKEYKVTYEDGSTDYVHEEDIDGIEVILYS